LNALTNNGKPDRDPEAEAEDKVEEEKLVGADEVGATAVSTGFAQAGGDEWATSAPGFSSAAAPGGAAEFAGGEEWGNAANPSAPSADWGATDAKDPNAGSSWA
jgi:small subunit ribosomal protein SAe